MNCSRGLYMNFIFSLRQLQQCYKVMQFVFVENMFD